MLPVVTVKFEETGKYSGASTINPATTIPLKSAAEVHGSFPKLKNKKIKSSTNVIQINDSAESVSDKEDLFNYVDAFANLIDEPNTSDDVLEEYMQQNTRASDGFGESYIGSDSGSDLNLASYRGNDLTHTPGRHSIGNVCVNVTTGTLKQNLNADDNTGSYQKDFQYIDPSIGNIPDCMPQNILANPTDSLNESTVTAKPTLSSPTRVTHTSLGYDTYSSKCEHTVQDFVYSDRHQHVKNCQLKRPPDTDASSPPPTKKIALVRPAESNIEHQNMSPTTVPVYCALRYENLPTCITTQPRITKPPISNGINFENLFDLTTRVSLILGDVRTALGTNVSFAPACAKVTHKHFWLLNQLGAFRMNYPVLVNEVQYLYCIQVLERAVRWRYIFTTNVIFRDRFTLFFLEAWDYIINDIHMRLVISLKRNPIWPAISTHRPLAYNNMPTAADNRNVFQNVSKLAKGDSAMQRTIYPSVNLPYIKECNETSTVVNAGNEYSQCVAKESVGSHIDRTAHLKITNDNVGEIYKIDKTVNNHSLFESRPRVRCDIGPQTTAQIPHNASISAKSEVINSMCKPSKGGSATASTVYRTANILPYVQECNGAPTVVNADKGYSQGVAKEPVGSHIDRTEHLKITNNNVGEVKDIDESVNKHSLFESRPSVRGDIGPQTTAQIPHNASISVKSKVIKSMCKPSKGGSTMPRTTLPSVNLPFVKEGNGTQTVVNTGKEYSQNVAKESVGSYIDKTAHLKIIDDNVEVYEIDTTVNTHSLFESRSRVNCEISPQMTAEVPDNASISVKSEVIKNVSKLAKSGTAMPQTIYPSVNLPHVKKCNITSNVLSADKEYSKGVAKESVGSHIDNTAQPNISDDNVCEVNEIDEAAIKHSLFESRSRDSYEISPHTSAQIPHNASISVKGEVNNNVTTESQSRPVVTEREAMSASEIDNINQTKQAGNALKCSSGAKNRIAQVPTEKNTSESSKHLPKPFPEKARIILNDWYMTCISPRYPNTEELDVLASAAGIPHSRIITWVKLRRARSCFKKKRK